MTGLLVGGGCVPGLLVGAGWAVTKGLEDSVLKEDPPEAKGFVLGLQLRKSVHLDIPGAVKGVLGVCWRRDKRIQGRGCLIKRIC